MCKLLATPSVVKFHPRFTLPCVPAGFTYYKDFLSAQDKQRILQIVDSHPWQNTLRRGQQYYGTTYFQTSHLVKQLQPGTATATTYQPNSLAHFQFLIQKLIDLGMFKHDDPPNQCLVGRYAKSNRLGLHIQDIQAFGDVICGISLDGPEWLRLEKDGVEGRVLIEDCSLYVLAGQARYLWRHGIGRNLADDSTFQKSTQWKRTSLTIRHVLEQTRRKLN